jgi:threonine synthase
MDSMLLADRSGHVACTQGGESLAGLRRAVELGLVPKGELAVLDSTAHHLKFVSFQEKYFEDSFEPEFEVEPREELINRPVTVRPGAAKKLPTERDHLAGEELEDFVAATAEEVARLLGII